MRYPWTVSQWQQVQSQLKGGKLPHAILLNGQSGLGKNDFAVDLAKSILCERPQDTGLACGGCRSCVQFQASTHPDYYLLAPEEAGKQIKVDQIRELIEQLTLSSHQGGYRVVIISPAENMNTAAANSLLKTLEEPAQNTLLILVTARPFSLPATILSRCQQLKFLVPDKAQSIEWLINVHSIAPSEAQSLLAMVQNAPLDALEQAETDQIALRLELFSTIESIAGGVSALQAAKPWLKLALPGPINWLDSWVCDLIRIKANPGADLVNRDLIANLHNLAQRVDLEQLFSFQDELTGALRNQRAPLNLQLLFESLLLRWERLTCETAG